MTDGYEAVYRRVLDDQGAGPAVELPPVRDAQPRAVGPGKAMDTRAAESAAPVQRPGHEMQSQPTDRDRGGVLIRDR
jgi:hypothetical protein